MVTEVIRGQLESDHLHRLCTPQRSQNTTATPGGRSEYRPSLTVPTSAL